MMHKISVLSILAVTVGLAGCGPQPTVASLMHETWERAANLERIRTCDPPDRFNSQCYTIGPYRIVNDRQIFGVIGEGNDRQEVDLFYSRSGSTYEGLWEHNGDFQQDLRQKLAQEVLSLRKAGGLTERERKENFDRELSKKLVGK
jgi:hypothetical protein